MLIKSMNEKSIVNMSACTCINIETDFRSNSIVAHCLDKEYILGTYTTESRCVEIIEEIANNYTMNADIFIMPQE